MTRTLKTKFSKQSRAKKTGLAKAHSATPESLGALLAAELSGSDSKQRDLKYALTLIKKGAAPNAKDEDGDPVLVLAARHNLIPVAKALLEKGADVNATCDRGQSALLVSSYKGHPEIAALALAHGADPNLGYEDNWPLVLAARYEHTSIVNGLLAHGARVDVQDSYGKTPLSRAAFAGYEDIVTALLKKGADVNLADNDGQTPLMWAAALERRSDYVGPPRRHIRIAEALLEAGADTYRQNNRDGTALGMAEGNKQHEIRELITAKNEKNYQADVSGGLPLRKDLVIGGPLKFRTKAQFLG